MARKCRYNFDSKAVAPFIDRAFLQDVLDGASRAGAAVVVDGAAAELVDPGALLPDVSAALSSFGLVIIDCTGVEFVAQPWPTGTDLCFVAVLTVSRAPAGGAVAVAARVRALRPVMFLGRDKSLRCCAAEVFQLHRVAWADEASAQAVARDTACHLAGVMAATVRAANGSASSASKR